MFSKKKKNINKVEVAPNTNENKEKTVKQIRFNYTVKDSDGREIKGYFDAFSKIEVQTFLQNQGYEVIKIEEDKVSSSLGLAALAPRGKMKGKELTFFFSG